MSLCRMPVSLYVPVITLLHIHPLQNLHKCHAVLHLVCVKTTTNNLLISISLLFLVLELTGSLLSCTGLCFSVVSA